MALAGLTEEQQEIVAAVGEFVAREVVPIASDLEHADEFLEALAAQMRDMGLFGVTIPEEYGGLGLSLDTYAPIVMELSRGWVTLSGIVNGSFIAGTMIRSHGYGGAEGDVPAAPGLRGDPLVLLDDRAPRGLGRPVDPHGRGARRRRVRRLRPEDVGHERLALRDRHAAREDRPGRRPSAHRHDRLHPREGARGLGVARPDDPDARPKKLGYKGVESTELVFDGYRTPAASVLGGEAGIGQGFEYFMSGIEVGRVNVAARGGGAAARRQAAQTKASGERADLEAGMAKYFATEAAQDNALDCMRIHGGYGYSLEYRPERYYRDAPLLLIGEGSNEIQQLIVARRLLGTGSSRLRPGRGSGPYTPVARSASRIAAIPSSPRLRCRLALGATRLDVGAAPEQAAPRGPSLGRRDPLRSQLGLRPLVLRRLRPGRGFPTGRGSPGRARAGSSRLYGRAPRGPPPRRPRRARRGGDRRAAAGGRPRGRGTGRPCRRTPRGTKCLGFTQCRSKWFGRITRWMRRMSRKPSVVRSATSAPLRSMSAFVATVVPCTKYAISRVSKPAFANESNTACEGFVGVESTFASRSSPVSSSSATRSVKVPPVSTPALTVIACCLPGGPMRAYDRCGRPVKPDWISLAPEAASRGPGEDGARGINHPAGGAAPGGACTAASPGGRSSRPACRRRSPARRR
jgi:butyryl-CoA dehydrogenase